MKQKVILIFTGSFFLFVIGLASCENDCGPFPNKFKIIGLDWYTYKATYSETSVPILNLSDIENDSVIYNQYSILIVPIQETYFAQNFNNWNFILIKTAYACSPLIPETDEKIDSIVIKSTKDFNENYPSGSDLADLFNVSHNPPAGTSLTAISGQVAGPGGSFALATPSRREPFRYRYGGQIHAKVAIQRKPGAA